ncbi:isopentenyl-diphosphate Delta-isomerase [Actinomadura montaniterrae]|jgi:isopentenyl-diphosphate delta-isomerase|uniref:Isopentenyl-diphosphate Delta-isomerase n=1 Tax=Actinomadura montaniterrae TaxID=1803903 RepID=A0A6L3VS76_9ACTN|nr:isopentenyl-diphosphate Delta-isomerase [Actinomadura montaniterrae]KAB2370925.1 isopentenyl-diphosphate Delta-isomerase [Actinomadura montaniterrae]
MAVEEIVLLNADDEAVGTAPKAASHHRDTPYHLAFSCYVVDTEGRVLITRRALSKRTFPGVWTGSCCGHPGPGEGLRDAVLRRLQDELGISGVSLTSVLPAFQYRAVAEDGTLENERCPVVRADVPAGTPVRRNPDEVEDAEWWTWRQCLDLAARPEASPWYRLQLAELAPLGEPHEWPDAGTATLPPALGW